MSVKINVPQFFLQFTDGVKTVDVNGSTIGECLNDLVRHFPSLGENLFDKDGSLHYYLTTWVNRESTTDLLADPVEDGDILDIIPVYVGG
ncbi:ThiS family protein [Chloroflexota bacterium]